MEQWLFYFLAALAIASASFVVLARFPIYGVLALVITMFSLAGLFVMLQAHFLAMIQVLIYAGAILVLFLFILMLLGMQGVAEDQNENVRTRVKQVSKMILSMVFLSELFIFISASKHLSSTAGQNVSGTIEIIGKSLFREHLLPFELVSLLLLISVIGVVSLSRKERSA